MLLVIAGSPLFDKHLLRELLRSFTGMNVCDVYFVSRCARFT